MKKTELEIYDYASLKKMLSSSDEENIVVALQCIDHMDFKQNMVTILLLFKNSNISRSHWQDHAPNTLAEIKKCNVDINNIIKYAEILDIMKNKKVSAQQVEKFIQGINESIKEDLINYGYDFIEEINIKINYKTDEAKS